MNDLTGYILSLCSKLSAENKTPSVAMIRSRSERPLPLPDIIRVLKMWQENPRQASPPEANSPAPTKQIGTLEERVARLEQQIDAVLVTLELIKAQVERLSPSNGRQ